MPTLGIAQTVLTKWSSDAVTSGCMIMIKDYLKNNGIELFREFAVPLAAVAVVTRREPTKKEWVQRELNPFPPSDAYEVYQDAGEENIVSINVTRQQFRFVRRNREDLPESVSPWQSCDEALDLVKLADRVNSARKF